MKVFFEVVAAVYVLYLFFLIVRACSELRHMPYVGKRCCPGAWGGGIRGELPPGGRVDRGYQASGLTWRGKTQGLVPFPQAGDQHLWFPGSHDRAEWIALWTEPWASRREAPGPSIPAGAAWVPLAPHIAEAPAGWFS